MERHSLVYNHDYVSDHYLHQYIYIPCGLVWQISNCTMLLIIEVVFDVFAVQKEEIFGS